MACKYTDKLTFGIDLNPLWSPFQLPVGAKSGIGSGHHCSGHYCGQQRWQSLLAADILHVLPAE